MEATDPQERPPIDPVAVEEVVQIMAPVIRADGGDIELVGIDAETGVVTVELKGACVSCPASTITMKAGIERIMKDRVPGVTAVVQPGDAEFELDRSGPS
ncbi:MAG: NifU family protein [Microthrixaceae bacterium]